MNITNTSNSALAQKVNLDPSHISRLRRGKRNAVKDEAVLTAMADYFARHCTADYQRKALADTMGINMATFDNSDFPALILKWLINEKVNEIKAVGGFLNSLNKINLNHKISEKLGYIEPKWCAGNHSERGNIGILWCGRKEAGSRIFFNGGNSSR